MKTFNKTTLAGVLALFTACDSSFDITPETQVAESPSMFMNEGGLETFSNGFYEYLDFNAIKDDKYSDNMEHISSPPDIRTANYTLPTDLGGGGWNWEELRNLNYFIGNVEQYTPDPALRDYYLGLARFFRAWFYFKKVKSFGDVPWYSKVLETTDEDLYKARDPRILVMDSVWSDLDFAIAHLSDAKSKNRITKWTALALKSRITLFEGTWRKYHVSDELPDADKWLQACVDASKELIDAGLYTLYQTGERGRGLCLDVPGG